MTFSFQACGWIPPPLCAAILPACCGFSSKVWPAPPMPRLSLAAANPMAREVSALLRQPDSRGMARRAVTPLMC